MILFFVAVVLILSAGTDCLGVSFSLSFSLEKQPMIKSTLKNLIRHKNLFMDWVSLNKERKKKQQ